MLVRRIIQHKDTTYTVKVSSCHLVPGIKSSFFTTASAPPLPPSPPGGPGRSQHSWAAGSGSQGSRRAPRRRR